MIKKLQKCDYIFAFSMILMLGIHLLCIFGPDHFADESFYPSVPLRLINGDSLIDDEWHLTQFSSIFLYLPVRFWLLIKGSTEGIVLFLRFFYLAIHTTVSIGVYAFFRKYKIWAVGAVLIFYSQVPLRFMSANYHSLLALFLLLFTLALLSITKNSHILIYLFAGICYACCCVCNPFECFVFPIYLLACICRKIKKHHRPKGRIPYKELQKRKQRDEICEKYFDTPALLKFCCGIAITAVICIIFFFATGGTISSLSENIPNLLNDASHNIFKSPLEAFLEKITITLEHINSISLGLPFLLPIFYIALLVDKKRRELTHKIVYSVLALILSVFFVAGVTIGALNSSRCLAITLPFAIVSIVSYILTENKNKKLFFCMWLPSVIATFIQYLASDLHLSVLWALTIGNIAGVFFVKDFVAETISSTQTPNKNNPKKAQKICTILLCTGICLQIIFQCGLYVIGKTVATGYTELQKGPYKGLFMQTQSVTNNNKIMDDLDLIKARTDVNEPVLIISEFSWMYLYIERPIATYSAWQPFLESNRLKAYYENNPDKIPSYIYIGYYTIPRSVLKGHTYNEERAQNYAHILKQMFDCEEEALSSGILLKVNQ